MRLQERSGYRGFQIRVVWLTEVLDDIRMMQIAQELNFSLESAEHGLLALFVRCRSRRKFNLFHSHEKT